MKAENIRKILIEGAGTMGTSMAKIFAENGYSVVLHGRHQETLDRAQKRLEDIVMQDEKNGKCSAESGRVLLDRIRLTLAWEDFADSDILIENIAENLEIKQAFYRKASPLMKEDALITTNTSGLSITALAEAVVKPERFVGFHWFNPPHLIPLIEVIAGEHTEESAVDAVYALAEAIGKKPIRVKKDVPGFIANRIQLAILRECIYMKEEGIGDFEDIDRAMKYGLGFRYACLGPFEVCDQGGLDIFYSISKYLYPDLSAAQSPEGLFADIVEKGNYGVKNGSGFYDYSEGKAAASVQKRDMLYQRLAEADIHREVES